jgi:hypothetical protein
MPAHGPLQAGQCLGRELQEFLETLPFLGGQQDVCLFLQGREGKLSFWLAAAIVDHFIFPAYPVDAQFT